VLLNTIRQGDINAVKSLIKEGADVNACDNEGNTALHYAARTGPPELAAMLLLNGADFRKANRDGFLPLNEEFVSPERLHEIRQHYLRLPLDPEAKKGPSSAKTKNYLEELKERGFVKIPALLDEPSLAELQDDFSRFIADVDTLRANGKGVYGHYDEEGGYRKTQKYYVTNNAFKYSDRLVKVAACDLLCELARHYIAKPTHLRLAQAMRYESVRNSFFSIKRLKTLQFKPFKADQFKWHHDLEDKQFKVMILLTNVGRRDQHMRYAVGTHMLFHPYERFQQNGLEELYCKQATGMRRLEIVNTTGKAGDAFAFDTNGMHAGKRSFGKVRDAFFLGFTANKQNVWGADVSEEAKRIVLEKDWSYIGNNPFERMLSAPKKWEIPENLQRTSPTWITRLYQPETWV